MFQEVQHKNNEDRPVPEALFLPPNKLNFEGQPRQVGVELEFGGLTPAQAAEHVKKVFGGTTETINPHRLTVKDTKFGDFETELDSQFVHPKDEGEENFRQLLGDIASAVVPCEIICPPIPVGKLSALDELIASLRQAGAAGTFASPFYAFGAQLNPDIATRDARWITSVFKAYLLLSDWLRAEISVAITRRLLAYAAPFPADYVLKVIDPDYWPDIDALIGDFLDATPTRNRELDMLPLFTWLNEDKVRAAVSDIRIKSRPTFHYRLPNALIDQHGWTVATEWNRWCIVEHLAANEESLSKMARAYQENQQRLIPSDWAKETESWVMPIKKKLHAETIEQTS